MDDDVKNDSWNHKARAKLRLPGERRFIPGMIHLNDEQMMFQPNTGNAVVKLLAEVISYGFIFGSLAISLIDSRKWRTVEEVGCAVLRL